MLEFSRLFQRFGGYSMPVLVELKQPGQMSYYFTNNDANITYGGHTYIATTMSYKPPGTKDGLHAGGSLEITIHETIIDAQRVEQELLKWFDLADYRASLEVIAIVNEGGLISEIGNFKHQFGTVSWDGEKITWNLGENDRLQMQINPWVFDNEALLG